MRLAWRVLQSIPTLLDEPDAVVAGRVCGSADVESVRGNVARAAEDSLRRQINEGVGETARGRLEHVGPARAANPDHAQVLALTRNCCDAERGCAVGGIGAGEKLGEVALSIAIGIGGRC